MLACLGLTHSLSMFANNALLGGGVRVSIREQRKIKRRSKALLKPLMANLDITLLRNRQQPLSVVNGFY